MKGVIHVAMVLLLAILGTIGISCGDNEVHPEGDDDSSSDSDSDSDSDTGYKNEIWECLICDTDGTNDGVIELAPPAQDNLQMRGKLLE